MFAYESNWQNSGNSLLYQRAIPIAHTVVYLYLRLFRCTLVYHSLNYWKFIIYLRLSFLH